MQAQVLAAVSIVPSAGTIQNIGIYYNSIAFPVHSCDKSTCASALSKHSIDVAGCHLPTSNATLIFLNSYICTTKAETIYSIIVPSQESGTLRDLGRHAANFECLVIQASVALQHLPLMPPQRL